MFLDQNKGVAKERLGRVIVCFGPIKRRVKMGKISSKEDRS
jgi:hypothetical protein